ncbi:sensor histidine kinase [Lactococcus ileimucosae]|uniref:sensor histidine kinase n=1 Tax=Lactococcus ileimucosae TaxID=2941329 RepID=UPI0020443302|nr:HAMP domain-containing sensor histidine kinase [Lactococcus ileimucosae]
MIRRKPLSIKARLLLTNIGFVFFAFLWIILIFNLLINNYISNSASSQLAQVRSYQAQITSPSGSISINLEDAPRGSFNTHPVAFNMNDKYEVQDLEKVGNFEKETANHIAHALKSQKVSLDNVKNYRLDISGSTFYIEASRQESGLYQVLYVDITGIINFTNSVNLFLVSVALAVILILSLAVTFVTQRLIKPLSILAKFATRIGQGDFTEYKGSFQDRELATLAHNMNVAARQLDNNDKNQKLFFQNASHELRTPLMAIKSYAEGISYEVMDPKKASETILYETDRMSELVEDLLTLSRLDSLGGHQEMARQDVRAIMRDIVKEQEIFAEQKGVKITSVFDKKAVMLTCNYKALRRAVSNLVSNAMRYVETELTLTCVNKGHEILISVANDGPVIDSETLPHIFERFYKGAGGVHGIGLAIVKSIVEQHRGQIYVKSEDNQTVFTMIFSKTPEKMLEKKEEI